MPIGAPGPIDSAGGGDMAMESAGRSASNSFTFLLVGLAPGTQSEALVSLPLARASA